MDSPNREGVPYVPSPDEIVAELCRQIYSDNLLDLFNTNASAALRLQVAHNDYKRLETEAAEEVANELAIHAHFDAMPSTLLDDVDFWGAGYFCPSRWYLAMRPFGVMVAAGRNSREGWYLSRRGWRLWRS